MEILFFGQLTDITKTAALHWPAAVEDTDNLLQELQNQFPGLNAATFIVAVNGRVIQQNSKLESDMKVALMPPFSGG